MPNSNASPKKRKAEASYAQKGQEQQMGEDFVATARTSPKRAKRNSADLSVEKDLLPSANKPVANVPGVESVFSCDEVP
jgi:hypothetical protein